MKLWKSALMLCFGNGATQVINFLFMIIVVRIFSPTDYSLYKLGNLLVATLSAFLVFGIPISLGYYLPRSTSNFEKNQYVVNAMLLLAATALSGAAALLMLTDFLSIAYNNPALKTYLWCFALTLFIETVTSYYPYYMIAENRNTRLAFVTVSFALLRVGTLLVSIYIDGSIATFLTLYVVNGILKGLFIFYDTNKDINISDYSINLDRLKQQITFSIPIGVSSILLSLNTYVDKNLTSFFYTPEQFAVYINGAYDIPFIGILTGSIMSVMLPEFSSKFKTGCNASIESILNTWHRSIVFVSAILIPIMYTFMVFADGIIVILFSEVYIGSTLIFRLYLLTMLTKVTYFGTLLTAANKQKKLIKYSMLSLVLTVVLYIIFNKLFGFYYVVLSVVISNFALAFMLLKAISEVYSTKLKMVYPWRDTLLMIAIGLLISTMFLLLKNATAMTPKTALIVLGPVMYILCVSIYCLYMPEVKLKLNNALIKMIDNLRCKLSI